MISPLISLIQCSSDYHLNHHVVQQLSLIFERTDKPQQNVSEHTTNVTHEKFGGVFRSRLGFEKDPRIQVTTYIDDM